MEAYKATTETEVGWDEAFQNVDVPPFLPSSFLFSFSSFFLPLFTFLEQCILFHEVSPNRLELCKDFSVIF